MSLVLLVALVSLAGTAWSLARVLDEAMIHAGTADLDVLSYFKALRNKDFKSIPAIYAKLEPDSTLLKSYSEKLKNAKIPNSAKSLKRLLDIEMDQITFKILGLLPELQEAESSNHVATPEIQDLSRKHPAPKPILEARKKMLNHKDDDDKRKSFENEKIASKNKGKQQERYGGIRNSEQDSSGVSPVSGMRNSKQDSSGVGLWEKLKTHVSNRYGVNIPV